MRSGKGSEGAVTLRWAFTAGKLGISAEAPSNCYSHSKETLAPKHNGGNHGLTEIPAECGTAGRRKPISHRETQVPATWSQDVCRPYLTNPPSIPPAQSWQRMKAAQPPGSTASCWSTGPGNEGT